MRTEHTTSEVTSTEGLTDAQFFYEEIMNLQKKCYQLEEELKQKEEKYRNLVADYDCLESAYDSCSNIVNTILTEKTKITKTKIIETLVVLRDTVLSKKLKHVGHESLDEYLKRRKFY